MVLHYSSRKKTQTIPKGLCGSFRTCPKILGMTANKRGSPFPSVQTCDFHLRCWTGFKWYHMSSEVRSWEVTAGSSASHPWNPCHCALRRPRPHEEATGLGGQHERKEVPAESQHQPPGVGLGTWRWPSYSGRYLLRSPKRTHPLGQVAPNLQGGEPSIAVVSQDSAWGYLLHGSEELMQGDSLQRRETGKTRELRSWQGHWGNFRLRRRAQTGGEGRLPANSQCAETQSKDRPQFSETLTT